MKKISILLLTIIMIFANTNSYAFDKDSILANYNSEELVTAIVELEDSPLLDMVELPLLQEGISEYLNTEEPSNQKDILLAKQRSIKMKINSLLGRQVEYKYSYTNTFNGFSAILTSGEIELINKIQGINSVYKAQKYKSENITYANQSKVIVGNDINTADIGFKGEGMVVAVIDTGVDFTHEDFRVSKLNTVGITKSDVTNLLKDKELKATSITNNFKVDSYYINEKFPFAFDYADKDNNSMPVDTHGTHVAGIIAANASEEGGIVGIAPETQVLSMKVFGDQTDQASDEDIIAAIEDSISLGADVINLSLGYATGVVIDESVNRYEKMFDNAKRIGITIVCAAGNESRVGTIGNNTYEYPLAANPDSGFIAFPSSLSSVLAVASSNDKSLVMPYFTLNTGEKIFYTDSSAQVKLEPFDTILDGKQLGFEYVGLGTKEEFVGKNVQGKIAVIDRGTYTFNEKVLNAEKNGAIGVIVINYDIENLLMLLTDVKIPAVCVSSEYKEPIMNAINGEITHSLVVVKGALGTVSNIDAISKFSSWGVTSNLRLKPDISAPGEQILSTAINNTIIAQNGTSMAAPQVTGAIMLINQYIDSIETKVDYNNISKIELSKMLLMSTATIATDLRKKETSPRQQGAGIINIEAATKTGAVLFNKLTNLTKIELGDKLANNASNLFSMQFTIRNITNKIQNYDVATSLLTNDVFTDVDGQVYSIDEEYQLTKSLINMRNSSKNINKHSKNYSKESIVLAPYEEKTLTLDVILDKEDIDFLNKSINGTFVEGFIECKPIDSKMPIISIPYMGFYGDWNQLPMLDSSVYDDELSFFQGQKLITEENGIEKELGVNTYLSEGEKVYDYDLIALSPNDDRKNEFMMASVNLFRDTKSLGVDILDNKGTVITNWTYYENIAKTQVSKYVAGKTTTQCMRFFGRDKNQNFLPEGNYTYIVKTELQVQSGIIDTWEIPFVIDTTSPVIKGYEVVSIDGIQTLELSLNDNHYIQAIIVEDQYKNTISQLALKEKYTPNETFKVSIPLVNVKGTSVNVRVIDYANNELVKKVSFSSTSSNIFKVTTTSDGNKVIYLTNYLTKIVDADSFYLSLERSNLLDTIKKNSVDSIIIDLGKQNYYGNTIDISFEVIKAIRDKNIDLTVIHKELTYEVSWEALAEANNKISIVMNKNVKAPTVSSYKNTGYNYEFSMYSDGTKLHSISNKIKVSVRLTNVVNDIDRISNFTYGTGNKLEVDTTYLEDSTVKFKMSELGIHSLLIYDKIFNDINGRWSEKYVNSLTSKGITKGTTETTFSPFNTISRAEFVAMVVRTIDSDIKVNIGVDFIGMDKNTWYYNEMIIAKQLGLIEGDSYDALMKINRFEMAMIASKAHAIINNQKVSYNGKLEFTDVPADSTAMYIGYAKENGLISGYLDNTFRPANNATREEITRVIYELIN